MSIDASVPACLEIRGLWKVFGTRPDQAIEMARDGRSRQEILAETGCTVAVRDVSFAVDRGETFVVMGLSGSGKSTLIRCVSRLTEATRGQVMLDDVDLTALSDVELREVRRRKLSMVFQHFGLFPHRRVIDNAAYGLEIQGLSRSERHARAREVLETVGLKGWESHFPQQLSGGMQQRVGLARALCVGPEVLFFDEPFSALDPLIRRDMQDELIRLQAEMRGTLVFITHDFAEAIKLGDRIAIMKDGEFDQIGTAAELITRPATPYVAEFTRDIPKAKVLTAADVMRAGDPVHGDTRTVSVTDTVEHLVPALLDGVTALSVVDAGGRPVGVVDRSTVAELLAAD
ncbi:MAG TPA: betaine/proline/choline family ABC transporter ATP-binding protein [Acidimicrobiia bacterium]|nr:betaine/proline/choline family ABC transporter ATP-binding protein [Acidimicrobiia bacterium]